MVTFIYFNIIRLCFVIDLLSCNSMMCVKANMFTSSLHVLRDSIKDTYILFVFVVSTVDIRASVFLLQNFVNSVSDFA